MVSITLVLSNYLPRSISQETFLNTTLEYNTLPFEPKPKMLLPPSLATFLHGATTVQWIALAMTTVRFIHIAPAYAS